MQDGAGQEVKSAIRKNTIALVAITGEPPTGAVLAHCLRTLQLPRSRTSECNFWEEADKCLPVGAQAPAQPLDGTQLHHTLRQSDLACPFTDGWVGAWVFVLLLTRAELLYADL